MPSHYLVSIMNIIIDESKDEMSSMLQNEIKKINITTLLVKNFKTSLQIIKEKLKDTTKSKNKIIKGEKESSDKWEIIIKDLEYIKDVKNIFILGRFNERN